MMPWEVLGGLDAILHVIFASIAMIILYPRRDRVFHIILLAIIMEVVIDGAHAFNKAYTHNIFFLLELPLFLLFGGYVLGDKKIELFSVLLFANNFTHLTMDLFFEGDTVPLYYPIMQDSVSLSVNEAGFFNGLAVWLMVIFLIFVLLRISGLTGLRSPPPYPSGR